MKLKAPKLPRRISPNAHLSAQATHKDLFTLRVLDRRIAVYGNDQGFIEECRNSEESVQQKANRNPD